MAWAGLGIFSFVTPDLAEAAVSPAKVDQIDGFVGERLEDNLVPGAAMAIVGDDRTVAVRTYGTTGRDGEPVIPETPFIICSVTKSFTAMAVMQLAERGRLKLDEPIDRYLPWLTVEPDEYSEEMTVRTLLAQTSGLSPTAGGHEMRFLSDASILETAMTLDGEVLNQRPGIRFEYANGNYVLLGALIEAVTGESYQRYLRSNVLLPIGMNRTYLDLDEAREHGLAEGHQYLFGWTRAHTSFSEGLIPAGGVISTAPDMARYLRVMLNGGKIGGRRILSSQGVKALIRPGPKAEVGPWAKDPNVNYAMGWYAGGQAFGPEAAVFHPGGSPDFGSMAILVPESREGLVLLYNATPEIELPGAAGDIDRIPAGAASILMDSQPADGWSMRNYYLAFDLIVAILIGLAALVLFHVIRTPPARSASRISAGARITIAGLGLLAAAALLILPAVNPGWNVLFLAIPDFSLVLLVLGVLVFGSSATYLVRSGTRR